MAKAVKFAKTAYRYDRKDTIRDRPRTGRGDGRGPLFESGDHFAFDLGVHHRLCRGASGASEGAGEEPDHSDAGACEAAAEVVAGEHRAIREQHGEDRDSDAGADAGFGAEDGPGLSPWPRRGQKAGRQRARDEERGAKGWTPEGERPDARDQRPGARGWASEAGREMRDVKPQLPRRHRKGLARKAQDRRATGSRTARRKAPSKG